MRQALERSGQTMTDAMLTKPSPPGKAFRSWLCFRWMTPRIRLIGEIIGSSGSDIGAHVVEDLATTPVWHRGPVVLIGVAAHDRPAA